MFAGLPTTNTLIALEALSFRALPCAEKIAALASNRSLRSIPGPRGRAPTNKAYSESLNATPASSVQTMPANKGKAQSSNSIATPLSASSAGVISNICKITGWLGPSISPAAMRNNRE